MLQGYSAKPYYDKITGHRDEPPQKQWLKRGFEGKGHLSVAPDPLIALREDTD